jgi:hypothetical protein
MTTFSVFVLGSPQVVAPLGGARSSKFLRQTFQFPYLPRQAQATGFLAGAPGARTNAMSVLSLELRAWLAPGLAGCVANADARGQPTISRIWAARALPDSDSLELYLRRPNAERFLANLAHNGRAAANLIEVTSYRSRAFKGACALSETPLDHTFLDSCLIAMNEAFVRVGMPDDAVQQMLAWSHAQHPWLALSLSVDAVFDQSPKKGAGARL